MISTPATVAAPGPVYGVVCPSQGKIASAVTGALAGATVIADERREFGPAAAPPGPPQSVSPLEDPEAREALRDFISERERRWCDEEIPALGGLTPRQAAADPVGRESLERLLGEYGSHVDAGADPELVVQHPDRLRKLIGLR